MGCHDERAKPWLINGDKTNDMALIFEDSDKVRSKSIPIPKNTKQVFKALAQIYEPYLDTVEGGKVLKSYASDKTYNKKKEGENKSNDKKDSDNRVSIDVAKMRLSRQNKFSPNSIQYQLYGGQIANNLLRKGIQQARAVSKVPNVEPPKPTAVKVPNAKEPEIKPIEMPKGQVAIKESIEDNPYVDYLDEYSEQEIVSEFFSDLKSGRKKQNWTPLISVDAYTKALREFTRYGQFMKFPGDMVYKWMGVIMRNTAKLRANTCLAGHLTYSPEIELVDYINDYLGATIAISEDYRIITFKLSYENLIGIIEDKFYNPFSDDEYDYSYYESTDPFKLYNEELDSIKQWEDRNDSKVTVDKNSGQITSTTEKYKILEWFGLYDWSTAPDGSDAWSDYGLEPIEQLIANYHQNMKPEDVLVLINKILDVYHCRGDLASLFIEGGSNALSRISEEVEKKTFIISEEQAKIIKEYYNQQRFNFDKNGEPYYKKDTYQLYIDFLESIGKYGQLPASNMNDYDIDRLVEYHLDNAAMEILCYDILGEALGYIYADFLSDAIETDMLESWVKPRGIETINRYFNDGPDTNTEALYSFWYETGFDYNSLTDEGLDILKFKYVKAASENDGFPGGIKLNERGLIEIEREITTPPITNHSSFTNGPETATYDDFYKFLKSQYDGVGEYWSWGTGEAYCGKNYGYSTDATIMLRGCVNPNNVDWENTICKNAAIPEEREIYIGSGYVEIYEALISGEIDGKQYDNVNILKRPIIVPVY